MARRRDEVPWLFYEGQNSVRIINAHAGGPDFGPPPPGVVAGYLARRDTDELIATDQSGSNDGTLIGGVARVSSGGRLAYSFGGSDERIQLAPFNVSPLHISLWVNGSSQAAYLLSQSNAASTSPVTGIVMLNTGVVRAFNRSGGDNIADSTTIVGGAGWRNVQVFFNSSGHAFIYVDGSLESSATSNRSLSTSFDTANIGTLIYGAASSFYAGLIDDIRVYNRQLTSDEIAYLAIQRGVGY